MTPEQLQRRLSSNIKVLRRQLEYSQEQLAELAQISYQMMNDIEGCRRWPSEKTLTKISNALKVDVSLLLQPEESISQLNPLQKINAIKEIQELFEATVKQYLENNSL